MRLEVCYLDRLGMAKDILVVLENYGINLLSIDASNKGVLYLKFGELAFETLSTLMPQIRKVESVVDVKTVAFMPAEQEHYAIKTLLKTLPDSVLSIDTKGRIRIINESALIILGVDEQNVIAEPLNNWVQGFNFYRWLTAPSIQANATKVNIGVSEYVAEMVPIFLPDDQDKSILAGAVISLKSPARLGKQFNALQNEISGFEHVFAFSDRMKDIVEQAKRMAQLDAPLLISGEVGTGKELIARACHDASMRRENQFVVVNCSTLLPNEADKKLFGFINSKGNIETGFLNKARGGTLFLKEVVQLPATTQLKLLAFLESKNFQPVGSNQTVNLDLRIICSSQKDLADLSQTDSFKQELYNRLHVLSFHIPPLRERQNDIIPLAEMFLEQYNHQLSSSIKRISAQCREYLINYDWSGNVRQLKNAIFRAISAGSSGVELTVEKLKLPSHAESFGYFDNEFDGSLDEAMKKYEASLLRRLYPAYPSTRQLAKKLGVSHTAIANKLREYKINKQK